MGSERSEPMDLADALRDPAAFVAGMEEVEPDGECPECGKRLPSKVVCNIYGTFCSTDCIHAATERGRAKRAVSPQAAQQLLAACREALAALTSYRIRLAALGCESWIGEAVDRQLEAAVGAATGGTSP